MYTGDVRAPKKQPTQQWSNLKASKYIADTEPFIPHDSLSEIYWRQGVSVVAISEDVCVPGSWVFARDANVSFIHSCGSLVYLQSF